MDKSLRFRFSKTGPIKYLSHLDIISMVVRALRRAGIIVKYSEGFNPKPKISFGPPIPLGVESAAEYADVTLSQDIGLEDFAAVINRKLEGRIVISGVREVPPGVKSLMSQVDMAEYGIGIEGCPADKDIVLKLAVQVLAGSGMKDSIYETSVIEAGSGPESIVLTVCGYTKTAKDRNGKVFKLRDFLSGLKKALEADGMGMGHVLKKELFVLEAGKKLTPFEVF